MAAQCTRCGRAPVTQLACVLEDKICPSCVVGLTAWLRGKRPYLGVGTRLELLRGLVDAHGAITAGRLASEGDMTRKAATGLLGYLWRCGVVERLSRGRYGLAGSQSEAAR